MNVSRIIVTPEADLEGVLATEGKVALFAFGSPTRPAAKPACVDGERFLGFSFNDIPEPRPGLVAPQRTDIAQLIDTARGRAGETLVFQCWFGVSRSTAAAVIAAVALGCGEPSKLAFGLRAAAPWATPNPLMIAHADAELGLRGELCDAVRAIGRGETTSVGRAFEWQP